ncbi:MAG: 50S ribosomal protein L11 methyltransferase [Gemmatimonadaceae bacterium]
MTWISLSVRPTAGAAEAVSAALFASGAQGLQEVGDQLVTQFETIAEIDAAAAAVRGADPAAEVRSEALPDVDWSVEWRRGVRAHRLGPLTVTPPWLADEHPADGRIIIDPGMAFGTGEHATTRGVVRLLPLALRAGDRVADLGAGSAVLSIAAALLGAGWVAAIELDPDAIADAEENVRVNGVADRVRVIEGDAGVRRPLVAPVRVVLANIISSVLIQLLPTIAAALAADGRAILSGILREERPMMLDALAGGGWTVEVEDEEDGWWSVLIARH